MHNINEVCKFIHCFTAHLSNSPAEMNPLEMYAVATVDQPKEKQDPPKVGKKRPKRPDSPRQEGNLDIPAKMKCHLDLSEQANTSATKALTEDVAKLLQFICLGNELKDIVIAEDIDLSNPFWAHLESVKRPQAGENGIDIQMRCPTLNDFTFISMLYNTAKLSAILTKTLLTEKVKDKHGVKDVDLKTTIPPDEFVRVIPKIQGSSGHDVTTERTPPADLATDQQGHTPACAMQKVAQEYVKDRFQCG